MKKIYSIVLAVILLYGCDSFLDVTPKGKLLPEKVQDFEELIGDSRNIGGVYPLADMCGDLVFMTEERLTGNIMSAQGKAYTWQEEFYRDEEDDATWNNAYEIIYTCNLVLQETPGATGGSDADKARVMAEARVNRAYYYWYLHSCYAPAYDPETAGTDLSVPLVLEPDLEVKVKRATSDKVVARILEDLKDVALDLPEEGISVYHLPRVAAYALAARVNLYFGNYDAALENAEEALKLNSKLVDYNTFSFKNETRPSSGINNRPVAMESPEMLMYRTSGFQTMLTSCCMSPELLAIFDREADLRYKFNFTSLDGFGKPIDEPYPLFLQELDFNIGVPEMMLIKAECLARKKNPEALSVLNTLRAKRFVEGSDYELKNIAADRLLEVVLEERQRELVYAGLRFFDMKRLAKEGIYTRTLTRQFKETTYTLEPNSNRYMFPIAAKIRLLNNSIEQNPR
ncbi:MULTISPECIES: RagB/SusD family nutrient uptake outer membrane protein [Butyricimonas]|uniref:RagB/SusD family nutrient uptake outer membrane protein n=1 Tax=Butyricimonas TaxID=574697 RepID=UPI0007FB248E|nr:MULTISPECIES: RagB/SusD family nutrient uptake outer membrane protein [Butyricimonas]